MAENTHITNVDQLKLLAEKVKEITDGNKSSISSLETKLNTKADQSALSALQTTVEGKVDEEDLASYATKTELSSYATSATVTELQNTVNDLPTTDAVESTVAEKIAEVVASAPEQFDTLKEIADWISTHTTDVATMNSKIKANEDAIKTKADSTELSKYTLLTKHNTDLALKLDITTANSTYCKLTDYVKATDTEVSTMLDTVFV